MRIVKELFRAAFVVWAVLGMAVLVDIFSAKSAQAWDCKGYNFRVTKQGEIQVENQSANNEPPQEADVFVNGQKVREGLPVPEMESGADWVTFGQLPSPVGDWEWRVVGSKDCEDSGEHEGEEPKPTDTIEPTSTSEATSTLVPKATETLTEAPPTLEPTATIVLATERPHDCHVDGDGICPGEETPTVPAVIIVFTSTPLPPKPTPALAPTEAPTSMVQAVVPTMVVCPYACCPVCCGCPVQTELGIGSEVPDYSEVILEFKPIVYILLGILGANTLLRTYGTFRKD